MSHHQRQSHVRARTVRGLHRFVATIEMMRAPDLEALQRAFVGDKAQMARDGDQEGVAFCDERLALIAKDLERREWERGARPRQDAGAGEG